MDPRTPGSAEVVLSEERLSLGVRPVAVERVRISKRIVEEVRTIEVPLRREELVVTREVLGEDHPVPTGDGFRDVVLVLSQEVPVVSLSTQPYETVSVEVRTVTTREVVHADLRAEHVDIDVVETGSPRTH